MQLVKRNLADSLKNKVRKNKVRKAGSEPKYKQQMIYRLLLVTMSHFSIRFLDDHCLLWAACDRACNHHA
jgi:hypothetical protein